MLDRMMNEHSELFQMEGHWRIQQLRWILGQFAEATRVIDDMV